MAPVAGLSPSITSRAGKGIFASCAEEAQSPGSWSCLRSGEVAGLCFFSLLLSFFQKRWLRLPTPPLLFFSPAVQTKSSMPSFILFLSSFELHSSFELCPESRQFSLSSGPLPYPNLGTSLLGSHISLFPPCSHMVSTCGPEKSCSWLPTEEDAQRPQRLEDKALCELHLPPEVSSDLTSHHFSPWVPGYSHTRSSPVSGPLQALVPLPGSLFAHSCNSSNRVKLGVRK